MTVRQYLEDELNSFCLFPDVISGIIELANDDYDVSKIMSKDIAGYPNSMKIILKLRLNGFAVEYLEFNNPKHYMLPYFRGEIGGAE